MNYFFELSEHGLAKEGCPKIIDLAVNDVGTHLGIARLLQKIVGQQQFVKCARHLSQENGVVVVLKELRLLRKPGVHGMSGFVREGVNVGKHVILVVYENV